MKHRTIAVDLAKSVFEIGISEQPGRMEKTHRLGRARLLRFMAKQQRATILMEACGSAHYWGRRFRELGHEVVLLPPAYVRPYVLRNKTDRSDVKGLLEAHRNSAIRPVPIKNESQQQLPPPYIGCGRHGCAPARHGSIRCGAFYGNSV